MVRVAIYARKSVESDRGDSIKNQFTKCREYVKATAKEGEKYKFTEYKDEGYSGANVFRPDFQRLERDIEAGNIDMLVCYRLDRITRSVADFSDINKKLEKHKVDFVSVSERFDTTTPTGRAMLGIVIVFAQLERETTRDRIIDNMTELAKTERWISGKAPLGYRLHRFNIEGTKKKQTKLVIDEDSAPNVQTIFSKYVELRSMSRLETFLLQQHIKSQNGKDLSTSQLALILKNPSYVMADERVKDFYVRQGAKFYGEVDGKRGLMTYGKTKSRITETGKQGLDKNSPDKWTISVGTHEGIIVADLWLEAQRIMADNHDKFPQVQKSHTALVSGILRCAECDTLMQVSYGRKTKEGEKGYYYACKLRRKSKGERCSNENARADLVDQAVIIELKAKGIDKERFISDLRERLKQGKQELVRNPVDFIKSDIKKKEDQVKRLIDRVSRTDNDDLAADYETQIRRLKLDISSLLAELAAIGDKKTVVYQTENELANIERLLDKCGLIDTLTLDEQRELVKTLFKSIRWNAETGSLSFEFKHFGNDNGRGDDTDGGGGNDDTDDNGGGFSALQAVVMGSDESSQCYTPLCQVVRNNVNRLFDNAHVFHVHSGRNHRRRLARTNLVSHKASAVI